MTARPDDAPRLDLDVDQPGRPPVRCGMCRRELHDHASRLLGVGPECARKVGLDGSGPRLATFTVEQDTIPGA